MKLLYCILVVFFISISLHAQTTPCANTPIPHGFGSDSTFSLVIDSLVLPVLSSAPLYLFHPNAKGKFPIIFLCHRYGDMSYLEYQHLITHLVSRGNSVIYTPARKIDFTEKQIRNGDFAYIGIENIVEQFKTILDTSKIGFIGHSFGAGAVPALAYHYLKDLNWGNSGSFMYLLSPWYNYGNDVRQLEAFPSATALLVQVFEEDRINDPKIALDIYSTLDIKPELKKFLFVRSDKRGDCFLRADNSVPLSENAVLGENNVLDYYGIFRMVDGLIAFSFYNSAPGYDVSLGNKGARECPMGTWPDGIPIRTMLALDSPSVYFSNGLYVNNWESLRNPRIDVNRFRQSRKILGGFIKKTLTLYAQAIKTTIQRDKQEQSFEPEQNTDIMPNPIFSGFGADSTFTMTIDSFARPSLNLPFEQPGWVYVFRPKKITGPVPVIFFLHGYIGQDYQSFQPLISHIVGRGLAVVYPTYPFLPKFINEKGVLDKYAYVYKGIDSALSVFKQSFDTTRIGVFGQSFGGGMVPAVTRRLLETKKFGANGSFMFMSAPWFSFDISQKQIAQFPSSTKLLMQVYNDDWMNDHQIAVDIFNSIGIPKSDKDYITLYTDSMDGYTMHANHFLPYGIKNMYGQLNFHDYYGVFRYIDALSAYCFTNDAYAKKIALGHGSKEQCFMGIWPQGTAIREATVTSNPKALHPELQYVYSWNNALNPRRLLAEIVPADSSKK